MTFNLFLRMVFSVFEMYLYSIMILIMCGIKVKDIIPASIIIIISSITLFNLVPSGGMIYLTPIIGILCFWLTGASLAKSLYGFIVVIFTSMGSNIIIVLLAGLLGVDLRNFNIVVAISILALSLIGYSILLKGNKHVFILGSGSKKRKKNRTIKERKS